jgi:hypothetical protein
MTQITPSPSLPQIYMKDATARCAEHASDFCEGAVGSTPVAAKGAVAPQFRAGRQRRGQLLW